MKFSIKVVCATLVSISSIFSADSLDSLRMSSSDKLKSKQKCLNNGEIHKSDVVLQEVGDNYLEDKARQFLEECKKAVKQCSFTKAVEQFRRAIEADGDPACFFLNDIVEILVDGKHISFEDLYTDVGITDVAKMQLQSLTDDVVKAALKTYYKNKLSPKMQDSKFE